MRENHPAPQVDAPKKRRSSQDVWHDSALKTLGDLCREKGDDFTMEWRKLPPIFKNLFPMDYIEDEFIRVLKISDAEYRITTYDVTQKFVQNIFTI